MMMKLPISRLNHLIEFGTTEPVDSDTIGGSQATFKPQQKLHCAIYQRSQNQQYALVGTDLENTIVVAVRSQYRVDKSLMAKLDDKDTVYRIVTISRDESHSLTRYDLITLRDINDDGGAD